LVWGRKKLTRRQIAHEGRPPERAVPLRWHLGDDQRAGVPSALTVAGRVFTAGAVLGVVTAGTASTGRTNNSGISPGAAGGAFADW
jgi:hypothetical protein